MWEREEKGERMKKESANKENEKHAITQLANINTLHPTPKTHPRDKQRTKGTPTHSQVKASRRAYEHPARPECCPCETTHTSASPAGYSHQLTGWA